MDTFLETAVYEIRIQGHLDNRRADWFTGMTITPLAEGVTAMIGPVPDQAALYGLLSRIRDLGVVLLLVRRLEAETGVEQEQVKIKSNQNSFT